MDMTTDPRTLQHKPLDDSLEPLGRPKGCDGISLVLQGGGALGAYQAGVYQALYEAGLEPDWVVGVSIGAINSSIIAGNPPERRLERLEEFWHWRSGYHDTRNTLQHKDWLTMPEHNDGISTHDIHRTGG